MKHCGIILTFKPLQEPLVTLNAKDAVPSQVTPTRNEIAPPPGQLGLGFRNQSALAAGLASQDLGGAQKSSQARVAPRGTRAEAPVLPSPELEPRGRSGAGILC